MKKITIADCSLKQVYDKNTTFREKTNIARCLDGLGIDVIELPQVVNTKEDTVIYRTISNAVKNASVAIPAGISDDEIYIAWNCISEAKKPCLQVVLPTSTVQMEYTYHFKAPKMLDFITKLVSSCRLLCENVEFVAEDSSRADREFLKAACIAAEKAGARAVTVSDEAGIMFPDEFAAMVTDIKSVCSIPVFVNPSNALDMAAACAAASIKAGAEGVKTTLTGDYLTSESMAEIFRAKGDEMGISSSLAVTEIHHAIENLTHTRPTAVQDSVSTAVAVSLTSETPFDEVCNVVQSLGYELGAEDNGHVYEEVRRVAKKKSTIGAKELEAIIANSAMQVPSTYHVMSYVINSGNIITAMAQVNLTRGEETFGGMGSGDGPIDAAFRAIEQIIGHHYELDEFQIQAVTEGREAMGSALVKLRANGKLYSGNGLSTDIVGASIRAYINAINKIVYEEN